MSSGHRSDGPALVALVAILVAIIFLAAFEIGERSYSSDGEPAQRSNQEIQQYAETGISQADASSNVFDFWRDSFPQYAMAALAAFATGASFWAIFEVRRTFRETKSTANSAIEANRTAREIGEAQVRAYIDTVDVTYRISRDMLIVNGRLCNNGQSPAFKFESAPHLSVNIILSEPSWIEIPRSVGKEEPFTLKWSNTRVPYDGLDHIFEGGTFWGAYCTFTWVDVFQKSNSINVSMMAVGGLSEADANGFRTGEMRVAYVAAEYGKEPHKA